MSSAHRSFSILTGLRNVNSAHGESRPHRSWTDKLAPQCPPGINEAAKQRGSPIRPVWPRTKFGGCRDDENAWTLEFSVCTWQTVHLDHFAASVVSPALGWSFEVVRCRCTYRYGYGCHGQSIEQLPLRYSNLIFNTGEDYTPMTVLQSNWSSKQPSTGWESDQSRSRPMTSFQYGAPCVRTDTSLHNPQLP